MIFSPKPKQREKFTVPTAKAAIVMLLALELVWAADPLIGTWKRNNATLKFDDGAGGRGWKDHVIRIQPNGRDGVIITHDITPFEGPLRRVTHTCKFDGQPCTDTESAEQGRIRTVHHANDRMLLITVTEGGQVVVKNQIIVSDNGKTLRYVQEGTNQDRKIKAEAVYNRQ